MDRKAFSLSTLWIFPGPVFLLMHCERKGDVLLVYLSGCNIGALRWMQAELSADKRQCCPAEGVHGGQRSCACVCASPPPLRALHRPPARQDGKRMGRPGSCPEDAPVWKAGRPVRTDVCCLPLAKGVQAGSWGLRVLFYMRRPGSFARLIP